MEDLKEIQKKAASAKTVKPAKPDNGKNKANKKQQMVIKNTNTAMGKALAAAMGGMAPDTPDKTNETPIQAAGGLRRSLPRAGV